MAHLPTSVPANFSTAVMYGEQNNTNNTTCPNAELKEWHITVLPVYILFITVLGIVLNVFVLMVFCLHKKACTMAEIYLSNMAAADLLLMTFLPFWAVYVANKFDWTFGNPLCRLVTLSITMNAYCSIYFLVLISIDRYVALVHPLSHEGMRRPKYAKLGCLLVWCFGLFLSVPTLVYREVENSTYSNSTVCHLKYPTLTENCLFTVMLTTIGFIIPLSIISFCTFRIIQVLKNRLIVGLNTKKWEQKATTLMLAVLLAFMICWVPFHLVKIVLLLLHAKVLTDCTIITIIYTCANIFMYFAFFNSVLNPILYVIVGKNFRKKVRELFKQWSINRTTTLSTTSTRSKMSRSVKTEVVSS
ncbi:B2 bradykinin receptor-like [Cebidichthys violaceus]|uniref:B2 bradykinin receptor-like n=1 Tax=Cebidichthys violaceus TaxID=271503 RepID=UPI0035CBC94F